MHGRKAPCDTVAAVDSRHSYSISIIGDKERIVTAIALACSQRGGLGLHFDGSRSARSAWNGFIAASSIQLDGNTRYILSVTKDLRQWATRCSIQTDVNICEPGQVSI